MARKPKVPEHVTEEFGEVAIGTIPVTRSSIVESMRARRQHPKAVAASDIVPAHVHEIYAQIWRAEDEARKAEERIRAEYSWRGLWRRLVARVVGKPRAPYQ